MFLTRDAAHIVVPWRQDLAQLIPHARRLAHGGQDLLLIPNRHDEAKLARNLGVPVPAPILTRYGWTSGDGRKPWEIQKTTAALLTESPRAYVLNTMGTGKTRSAIFAADYLMTAGALKRVLITAPLSTLGIVWEQELFKVLPRRTVRVLYGDRAKRLKLLKEDAEFYIVNHHGMRLMLAELVKRGFGCFIIDELAVFRSKGTELWKAATTVVNAPGMGWAWGLTGSPTPKAPTDAWAQIKMLTPANTTRTMNAFKDQTMRQVSSFKWVAKPDANGIVHAAMQPSVRFTLDDVMELPATSYLDREVKLETEAAKAYKMLFDKMRLMTQRGDAITAANEGVLHNKLLQVSLGFIYTDKGTVYRLPGQARLDALQEWVDEADRKVIVFVPYLHAMDGVAAHLSKHGRNVAMVNGSTPRALRERIFRGFQEGAHPDTLVAHPQCMAHGLTLTSANTIIWYGPTSSLETYEQANARIVRPGQTSKTLIGHIVGSAVEKLTYSRLRSRSRMQGMLLELFRGQDLNY